MDDRRQAVRGPEHAIDPKCQTERNPSNARAAAAKSADLDEFLAIGPASNAILERDLRTNGVAVWPQGHTLRARPWLRAPRLWTPDEARRVRSYRAEASGTP